MSDQEAQFGTAGETGGLPAGKVWEWDDMQIGLAKHWLHPTWEAISPRIADKMKAACPVCHPELVVSE